MPVTTIHTLDARDNVLLEVTRDYFKVTPDRMFREIVAMRESVVKDLALKGINYDSLKTALVPDRKRRDVALVFDRERIASGWYGYDIAKRVVPLFDKSSNHSVLLGDYLSRNGNNDLLFEAFRETVEPRRDVQFGYPNQFFFIYINNLTDAMIQRFDKGLADYEPYVGIADMTFSSRLKVLLSTMLAHGFIKHGRVIIQGHEPDRDPDEDINMSGYPFEENGYQCRSIDGDMLGVLLSYKIERPILSSLETDTEFALNAISETPLPLDDFRVDVAEAKLAYLKREKSGSLKRSGLADLDARDLEAIIRERVNQSYIYNLALDDEHNTAKFNVIIELRKGPREQWTRLLASLEYIPDKKTLRLITLY